jgi:hypothetical protein
MSLLFEITEAFRDLVSFFTRYIFLRLGFLFGFLAHGYVFLSDYFEVIVDLVIRLHTYVIHNVIYC